MSLVWHWTGFLRFQSIFFLPAQWAVSCRFLYRDFFSRCKVYILFLCTKKKHEICCCCLFMYKKHTHKNICWKSRFTCGFFDKVIALCVLILTFLRTIAQFHIHICIHTYTHSTRYGYKLFYINVLLKAHSADNIYFFPIGCWTRYIVIQ